MYKYVLKLLCYWETYVQQFIGLQVNILYCASLVSNSFIKIRMYLYSQGQK